MTISVVIPTVPGREVIYQQTVQAYRDTSPRGTEIITEYDHPTVGCAWQHGAEDAHGDYIHLGNDDCIPHEGWWEPAVEACDAGFIPSPQVYAPDGTPQGLPTWGVVSADCTSVHCCLIPFMSRGQWEKIGPLCQTHYYSDNFITLRARAAGWACVLRTGYAFTHHWSQVRRGAGQRSETARHVYDRPLYEQALKMVNAGEWVEAWPPGGMAPA